MRNKKAQLCRKILLISTAVTALFLTAKFSTKDVNKITAVDTLEVATSSSSLLEPLSTSADDIIIPASAPIEVKPELESLGEFVITAYCPCVICCGEWSAEYPSRVGTDYIQKTASGTIPTAERTISVDPSVIKFGAVVIVNGHEYVAEDCGGAIKGNKIDIFFDNHEEALEFGRQTAEIFIKK